MMNSQIFPNGKWVELQTKVCEDFTITEKTPTRAFNVKVLTSKVIVKSSRTFG